MLVAIKRKLAILATALAVALGVNLTAAGVAFAWHDKVDVSVDGCVVTISATGLTFEGKPSDHIEWKIFAAPYEHGATPVAKGTLVPSAGNPDIAEPVTLEGDSALPPGDYVLKWWLFISDKNVEKGDKVPFTVGVCETPSDEPSETPSDEPSTPTDEPSEPADEPTADEPPADQGSTLPKTGSGFPTGTAAAFALLLISVGGLLLTWRRGMLALPYRRRH